MSRLRPFKASDLFTFNRINLDHFTETYSLGYYLQYLATWPELCFISNCPNEKQSMGYLFGKGEGNKKERHGHVTAVTVAPEFRRLGLAQKMMQLLEIASDFLYDAWFIDLFVRPSNSLAVGLYQGLQYSIYRRVKEYYAGGGVDGKDEDGYDMRKALPRDTKRETVRDSKKGINVVIDVHSTFFDPAYRI